jgi:4-amino-4-deoxy-L-arabinose transferase-like glycosyltransferase
MPGPIGCRSCGAGSIPDTRLAQTSRGLFVFLLLFLCYAYFIPRSGRSDWAASARADLVFAVADRGDLTIDAYHENTGDKAFYQGHYYAVGSIGPSLLALPAYLAARPVLGAFRPERREQAALYAMTLLGAALPGALLGLCVYAFARRFTPHEGHAVLLALTYGLATPAFPYSKALLQHQASALGAFAGFYLLWRVVREGAAPWRLYAAGGLFGLAAISEYPVVLFLAMIFLWAWMESGDRGRLVRVVWGALPPLLLFAAYNQAIFGTPLPVGYRYHVEYGSLHAQGFMGITQPSWAALYGITLSPYRGLLWLSPVLALAVPGVVRMWRHSRERLVAVLLCVIAIVFLLYVASYEYWSGGDAIGPRFLVPLVPFLTIPMAYAFDAILGRRGGGWVLGALIVLSLANVWAQSVAGHRYPPGEFRGAVVTNPTVQWALPLLREGQVTTNLGMLLGLSGLASLLPLGLLAVTAAGLVRLWPRPPGGAG